MRSIAILFVVATMIAVAWGQEPSETTNTGPAYTPAVPAPSIGGYGGYGGHWGGGGASTVAGSSLRGMADVISAKGDYNLSTSAAAVNMTQAEKQKIKNRSAATNTYFQMRQVNRRYRDIEAGPRPTMEQLTRLAKAGLPRPLSPNEVNEVTGQVQWPSVLQTDRYAKQRAEVEKLSAARAKYGELGYTNQVKLRELVNAMAKQLKTQIRDIPTRDYILSKNFLNRLLYAGTGSTLG